MHAIAVAAGLLLALITLPGTIELALLTFAAMLPRWRRSDSALSATTLKTIAVVIPAHDEAGSITACVQSVAACAIPSGVEAAIVVVADNCIDATAQLARAAGARVIEREDAQRRGKGFALELAFTQLLRESCDAVMVIDADTVIDRDALVAVAARLTAGADGVQLRYAVLNPFGMRARLMNVAFMAFNLLRPRGRARLGLSAGIFGNGFALSRATLLAVPYDAHSVVEDLEYHLRMVAAGRRVAFVDQAAVRAEMPTGGAGARTQRARWEGGRLRMMVKETPRLVRAVMTGNLHLLEPLLDLLLLPLAFHVVLLLAALIIPWPPSRAYAIGALLLVALHVAAGIVLGGGDRRDFAALMAAPFYVAWKLAASPLILKSARRAAPWIRTVRNRDA